MAKKPKAVDKMTRAELIRCVRTLQKRVAKLERQLPNAEHPYGISERAERVLNELAPRGRFEIVAQGGVDVAVTDLVPQGTPPEVNDAHSMFPWQASLPNSFEGPK